MSFLAFILEYITYCMFLCFLFLTFILCFKIGKYLADFYYNQLKTFRLKLINFIRSTTIRFLKRKERTE